MTRQEAIPRIEGYGGAPRRQFLNRAAIPTGVGDIRTMSGRFAILRKQLGYGLFLVLALVLGAWIYVFHGYISGNRWAWVKYRFGTYDSATVILGKDGWLFTRGGSDDVADYRGLATRGNRVIRFRELLTKRNELVRSLGGRFLYIAPPISETIYNELLPQDYQKVGNRRRATLAMEELRGSGVEMLSLV